VQPSIKFSVRNRRPLAKASCVKSIVHIWSGSVGGANTTRAAAGARRLSMALEKSPDQGA
jgi:hypothetical protein